MVAWAMRWTITATALAALAGPASPPPLPDLAIDSFPEVSRAPISTALAQARAHPSDASRIGAPGMVLQAWEQWEAAAAVYTRARALERRYDWYYLAAVAESRLAHHDRAAALLRDAVALSPTVPARLALADALFESGAIDDSEPLYRALVTEPVAEPHARYGLGRVLASRGEYPGALQEFDTALRLYPDFGAAWYAKGLALRRVQRVDEAKAALERAQALGSRWPAVDDPLLARVSALRDDPGVHMRRGVALSREGDVAGAIREHEAALASNPALAQAHANLISLYGQQGAWEAAESHYREAVRLGITAPEAHYDYGLVLLLQHRDADAADAFRRALAANPQHPGAWNNLGQVAEHAKQWQEALEDYRRAAVVAPGDETIHFNVARMLVATKQYAEAIPVLEKLSTTEGPSRARYTFGLATAWVLSGQVAKGRQYAIEARTLAAARGQTELVAAIDRDLAQLPNEP